MPIRIRVIQRPPVAAIDGFSLDQFEPGKVYEVGTVVGSVMLAEGWAVPLPLDEPLAPVSFTEADPFEAPPFRDPDAPPNLSREHYPPYLDTRVGLAADFERRKRARRR